MYKNGSTRTACSGPPPRFLAIAHDHEVHGCISDLGFCFCLCWQWQLVWEKIEGWGLSSMAKEQHENHTIPGIAVLSAAYTGTRRAEAQDTLSSSLGATDLPEDTMEVAGNVPGETHTATPICRDVGASQSTHASGTRSSLVGEPHTGTSVTAKPGNHHHVAGLGPSPAACSCCVRAGRADPAQAWKHVGKHGRPRGPLLLRPGDPPGSHWSLVAELDLHREAEQISADTPAFLLWLLGP